MHVHVESQREQEEKNVPVRSSHKQKNSKGSGGNVQSEQGNGTDWLSEKLELRQGNGFEKSNGVQEKKYSGNLPGNGSSEMHDPKNNGNKQQNPENQGIGDLSRRGAALGIQHAGQENDQAEKCRTIEEVGGAVLEKIRRHEQESQNRHLEFDNPLKGRILKVFKKNPDYAAYAYRYHEDRKKIRHRDSESENVLSAIDDTDERDIGRNDRSEQRLSGKKRYDGMAHLRFDLSHGILDGGFGMRFLFSEYLVGRKEKHGNYPQNHEKNRFYFGVQQIKKESEENMNEEEQYEHP
jgi:hypothetical protein